MPFIYRPPIPLSLHLDHGKGTGVDALAVAIGTSHGAYKFKGEAKLDFERLPGAKGIPDEAIQKGIPLGICKINIDTDLRLSFVSGIREVLSTKPDEFDPRKILGPGRDEIIRTVQSKMRLFASSGRAP